MDLKLTKPLAFIDLEATGLNISKDRIVEIAIVKVLPNGSREKYIQRVNPKKEISEEAYNVHKIAQEELDDEPTFEKIAKTVANFLGNADLSGFNIMKFDLPMIMEEFLRANVEFSLENRKVIDVQHIFHKKEKRDLAAAYRFYCGSEIINQHSAEADVTATLEVLNAQLDKYDDLENNTESLFDFTGRQLENMVDLAGRIVKNSNGDEVFNFGKYKGKKVFDIFEKDSAYYGWMMKGDFPQYTKKKLTELILKWKQER